MAIEVNEFQTQLTDELLDSLDREVRDTLIEYISNVPFIQSLISPNREIAKDRPRDSQGRIIVDLVKPHILEDMDYFRPALMHFREHGVYTKLKPNSNKNSEYYRFLKQEVHRCRYGMVRPSDGEWVTGHLYFYLNYMPITVVRLDASKTFGTRLDDFPDMWEGIYWRYHYIEQARYGGLYNDFKGGQHGAEIACRGASKAHPYDEFVYTPNGVKKWGDIEVGDVLFGDDGKPTTIIDIPFDGEDDVYEIELKDGRKVRSSKDHNWVVYRRGVKKIISTYDLFKKHKYQRAKSYRNPTGEESIYKIKLQNECIYNETETKIDPYTMGLILGDGSFRHKKINTAGFTALEKDVDEYRNYIPYKIYKESKNSKFGWRINIPNYRDVIREYGLDMLYSNEKFIPNEYIYNSVKTRKDILTGLIDSDGTIDNKGAYHISLSSKKLIENIREICISLGYGFKLGEERKTYYYNKSGVKIECKSSYPIYIYTTDVLCKLNRKKVLLKDKNTNYSKSKSSYSVIVNVNYIDKSKCKCVTVDNESGSYLINEYVPTHNSYSVAAILAKLFLLGENDLNKSKVKANMFSYLKEYLNKDGTLDKFVNAINHCGDHTEFPSLRLKDSMSEMQWKSGFMDSENRPRGSQNEVLGLAIKDDPGKARGKRPHPYSEKAITYSGIKKWGDIKIGDTLIGDDGKPTNVIQIHEVGEQDIYKIELSDGRAVHSTLDHLWQVDILNEKVDKTTEELIDLIKSNYVYIRSCSPIESLCEKDIDVVEFIDSGGNILELSIDQRLQYFKAKYDDNIYYSYLWINDLDKKEVDTISRIARSLGWGCYSGSHSVRINKCPSKSRIINIELVGREQAKCVTVDNDSHLYLIGDFVITHNSSFQAVEEFGFFPNYLDFYQTTLPNVQEGQAAAGQSYSIGCVCAGTKVYKHDGELINIEDLSKEDGICGYDGAGLIKEDVTYIQDEAYKNCFRIETEHNRFIECSYDHPLLVIDNPCVKKSKQKAVFKRAEDIIAGDKLLLLNNHNVFGEKKMKSARLIGLLLGDGSYANCTTPTLSIATNDLYEYVNSNFDIGISKLMDCSNGDTYAQVYIKNIKNYLVELGIWGQSKDKKELPKNIHQYDRYSIKEMLSGYFEADGNVQLRNGNAIIKLSCKYRKMLEDIRYLLLKFGINSNIVKEKKGSSELKSTCNNKIYKLNKFDCYVLYISKAEYVFRFIKEFNFISKNKQERLDSAIIQLKRNMDLYDNLLFDSSPEISSNYLKNKELLNNLESIKVKRCDHIGNKRIYNLTTSKTHTYVTNGFISHNTGGEENSDFTGALELIQSPSGYNIYGLPNFYDKGSNGSRKTIFFFPGYINRIGYYNKDGVSDVIGAMLSEIKYRVNLKYNSSDPMMLTRRKAETAFTLQDAIMRRSGSIFPSAELNDRINELDSNPSSYNDMYVGYLYIEDGEVKFKPDSDLQPIMEFPHKDNKKEGAVHILRMPEKDSSGKVPNGRYIAGSDVYDDDTSETLSLGSFYILDLFTDDLVFEYTGRPMFADDFYEICRRACLFYNAELNYENNKKGLFKYFSQHNSLYLLSDTLEFLADKEIIKPGTYGNKKKGVGNYGQVAPYGRRCIRDYLLKPVEMERQIEKADGTIEIEEVNIMKLHTIKYRALLQELSMWSEDLNTDRVDALAMLMLLREDRLRLAGDDGVKKSVRKDDATYLGNDDYFNRNYKNKHN